MRKVFALAATMLVCLSTTARADVLLNLAANQYGRYVTGHPSYALPLAAGDWQITLVSPGTHPQALYWAWQPWASVQNWHTACQIYDGTTEHGLGVHNATATAQEAFWQTVNSGSGTLTLHLDAPSVLRIGVCDSVIGDNGGGVSLLITEVPEPSSLLALAGGIGALLALKRRR